MTDTTAIFDTGKDRLLSVTAATGAKVMSGLRWLLRRAEFVHKNARSQFVKRIAFKVVFLTFKLHQFVFQIAFLASNKLALRIALRSGKLLASNLP
jgi:hypothetical protein